MQMTESAPAQTAEHLVKEAENLASDVLPPSLLVVHDASRGGEHDVTELTGGEQVDNPLLKVVELDVVAGRDDTALVQATVELDDDLAVAVVVNLFELANVACLLGSNVSVCATWNTACMRLG